MKHFIAQVIYRIGCEGVGTEQYDEQWRLVYAEDERMALEESRRIALEDECSFTDRHGRQVHWKLIAVKDLRPVELGNGALLFSSVKEIEPVTSPVWAA